MDSSRWGSSRRVRWAGGGPQLREEEAGARTDADLAGLSLLRCLFFFFFFLRVSLTQVCSAGSSSPLSPQDVQLKVKAYILGTDMSNFKYDDFIVVLDVISRYASGGDSPASSPLSLLIGCHRPRSCRPSSPNCLWTSFFFFIYMYEIFLGWSYFLSLSFFYIHHFSLFILFIHSVHTQHRHS